MNPATRFTVHPPCFYRCLYPDAMWLGPVNGTTDSKPVAYITFDDGPNPDTTPRVLECLDRFNAKATFFMVGENVSRYPELYKEITARGHSTGNHTMHHLQGLRCDTSTFIDDIEQENAMLRSPLFRPPHGLMKPSQYRLLKKRFKIVMFDIVTMDYSPRMSVNEILSNIERFTRNGSIIVFHDSHKAWPRLEKALPETLALLKNKNYELLPLPMDR